MKQYTNHEQNATLPVNRTDFVGPRKGKAEARDEVPGFSRTGTLTNTQIITSEFMRQQDRLLDIYYKEWQEWLDDYRLRQLNRNHYDPFTPTDFS